MANRRFAVRSRKRAVTWQGAQVDFADLVAGTAQFSTLITESQFEDFPTPTLIRTRGRLMVVADTSSTPGAFGDVTMGIMLVTAAAAAATGVPSPVSGASSDWLWWDVATFGAAAGDVIGEEITVDRIPIDSKAMRKVGNNMLLIFVAEMVACEGTLVANLCGRMRFLLKAP